MSKKSRERREASNVRRGLNADGSAKEIKTNDAQDGAALLEGNSEQLRREGAVPQKAEPSGDARRRQNIYIWCVVGVSVVLAVFILLRMHMSFSEQLTLELVVNETDITYVDDGIYTASYESSHMSATVSVSIASGRIIDIELDSFTGIDNARAEVVFDSVIFYQMLNVPDEDIGTQPTDMIVLKAIENALVTANQYSEG